MRRSTERILTTHAGSLPRPDALREAWSKPTKQERELEQLLRSSVSDVVKAQVDGGACPMTVS
jgi:5-methyltetrahydropteroyltriglutamate--homocysteine methyltransferase